MPKLISIPVSEIVMNVEDNSRRFTSASVENMTLQLLDANKQLEPVGVVKYKSGEHKGKYRLAYGFRRVHALQDINDGQLAPEGSPLYLVQALLHDDLDANDDHGVFKMNVTENAHRQELSAMDQSISANKMADEFGYDTAKIATLLGVSKARVSQIKALMKLPVEVQQAIERGDISSSTGYELSKEKDESKLMEAFQVMMGKGGKVTREDAKEALRAQAEVEAEKAGETPASSDGSNENPDSTPAPAKAASLTRSWKAIQELLDIYRLTDDKKSKGNRQKLVEALIAYRNGGKEITFRKAFEQYVPE